MSLGGERMNEIGLIFSILMMYFIFVGVYILVDRLLNHFSKRKQPLRLKLILISGAIFIGLYVLFTMFMQ